MEGISFSEKRNHGLSRSDADRKEQQSVEEYIKDSLQNEPAVTWTQDVYAAQEDVFSAELENL